MAVSHDTFWTLKEVQNKFYPGPLFRQTLIKVLSFDQAFFFSQKRKKAKAYSYFYDGSSNTDNQLKPIILWLSKH